MPAYKKKITRQMTYEEFEQGIQDLEQDRQAFLNVLFLAGCRVSEALSLASNNITCTPDTIFIEFHRLKGSKQTDPIPLPRNQYLNYLCYQEGRLFPWCRTTGYNIVRRAFDGFYPHFFRQNRVMKTLQKYGIPVTKSFFGFRLSSMEHYVTKVDIANVGKALKEEIG